MNLIFALIPSDVAQARKCGNKMTANEKIKSNKNTYALTGTTQRKISWCFTEFHLNIKVTYIHIHVCMRVCNNECKLNP